MTVFLDLDGVLCDFVRSVCKFYSKTIPMRDVRWGLEEQLGFDDPTEFWSKLGFEFWRNLQWTLEGPKLLQAVETIFGADNVCILTSPCSTKGCADGKLAWIADNIPAYRRRYAISPAKQFLAGPGKLLIDDHANNVNAFAAAGGKTLLIPRPWNDRRDETNDDGDFDVAQITEELLALRDNRPLPAPAVILPFTGTYSACTSS